MQKVIIANTELYLYSAQALSAGHGHYKITIRLTNGDVMGYLTPQLTICQQLMKLATWRAMKKKWRYLT
jgi:hypothetical protein